MNERDDLAVRLPGEPSYAHIKRFVTERIARGSWKEGDRVSSESELVRLFKVSRMTAHRALRELTTSRVLKRVQGLGTFVAAPKVATTLVTIRSIHDEILERGHRHTCDVLELCKVRLAEAGAPLRLPPETVVFKSVLLHRENGLPLQLEIRFVNPEAAPGYLKQDFTRITPNQYLTKVAPAWRAEYAIEATVADRSTARRLSIAPREPCLVLTRQTWTNDLPVSYARLIYPGARHRFTGQLENSP